MFCGFHRLITRRGSRHFEEEPCGRVTRKRSWWGLRYRGLLFDIQVYREERLAYGERMHKRSNLAVICESPLHGFSGWNIENIWRHPAANPRVWLSTSVVSLADRNWHSTLLFRRADKMILACPGWSVCLHFRGWRRLGWYWREHSDESWISATNIRVRNVLNI